MSYFAIAAATSLTIIGSWQHNIYMFLFGCAWLIAAFIATGADSIARAIAESHKVSLLNERNLVRLMRERPDLGASVGRAINTAASRKGGA